MKLDLTHCTCLRPDGVACTNVRCPVHGPPELPPETDWDPLASLGIAVWEAHQRTGRAASLTANPKNMAVVVEWWKACLTEPVACSVIAEVGKAFARRNRDPRSRIGGLWYYRPAMRIFQEMAGPLAAVRASRERFERWKRANPREWRRMINEAIDADAQERSERAAARTAELERQRAAAELRAQEIREITGDERRQAEHTTDASADLATARCRARAALASAPGSMFAEALADIERRARRST